MWQLQSRYRRKSMRNASSWHFAVLSCFLVAGCNAHRVSQDIAPGAELGMSTERIQIGPGELTVPFGWTVKERDRRDENGHPLTIWLMRSDKQGRYAQAYLRFEVVDDPPSWHGSPGVRDMSTQVHENVSFIVHSIQEPSGDDTPAHSEVSAFLERKNRFWCMYATFFTPVTPELTEAIKYIDAICIEPDGV